MNFPVQGTGFRLFRFRSPLLAKWFPTLSRDCFIFLALLRCFSSDGSLFGSYVLRTRATNFRKIQMTNNKFTNQIRKSNVSNVLNFEFKLMFVNLNFEFISLFIILMRSIFTPKFSGINPRGFLHSDTDGSQDRGSYPSIIAALRVLHR